MAEVLASKLADLDNLTDGDGFTYSWFDMERPDLARELTDALTAAGFGLVADAKREALTDLAGKLDTYATNVNSNNHILKPAWTCLADGYKRAAEHARTDAAAVRGDR